MAQAQNDRNERLAGEARRIYRRMAIDQIQIETPEAKLVKTIFKRKSYDLPARIFNPFELNAEYILIKIGKYKNSVTQKEVDVPQARVGKDIEWRAYLPKKITQWAARMRSDEDSDRRFNGEDQPLVVATWFAVWAHCYWLSEVQGARGENDLSFAH